jgi:hypothetical protein
MIEETEIRAFLLSHGAQCRTTLGREYWFLRGWNFGTPIGIAYCDMLDKLKRLAARDANVATLKAAGMKYKKDAGWFDPEAPILEFMFQAQALEYIRRNDGEETQTDIG